MFSSPTLLYLVLVLAAASAILAVEALYMSYARRRSAAGLVNRRLQRLSEDAQAEQTLKALLQERGLSNTGNFTFRFIALNRLYTQSGITGSPAAFAAMFFAAGIVVALVLGLIFSVGWIYCLAVLLAIALLLPLFVLRQARGRRIAKFATQLPDALDMIVRSLRAGHPSSVAIGLVAREMPDPLGTEFGMTADEITFGLSIEQAARRLSERVGFEGLHLLSVSLSIQAKTGGNLTDILANLSKVLRERQKLKLKIYALSAEGRWSARLISAFPFLMFGILMVIAPKFYGDVWGNPIIVPVFVLFGLWMLIGDIIIYRMVNFDY